MIFVNNLKMLWEATSHRVRFLADYSGAFYWWFCGKAGMQKIEKIQYRALKFVTEDYLPSYEILLQKSCISKLLIVRIKQLAI